ncbi:MAG: response regulator [Anaerolineae bacterium]|nr:response regulator [Anaerolineae bacterium]
MSNLQRTMANEKKGTILIIDDDPATLDLLEDYLQDANYRVLVAEDGQSGLKRANEAGPDLILLDVMMLGIDGFEVCHRLKEAQQTKDIPVIFMTALDDSIDKVKGFEAGAVDYITKPMPCQEILARVNTHLTIFRLQKSLQNQNRQLKEENFRRRRVQDALRESRERYRLLAENSTDMISRQSPEGVYLYMSPACRTVLGYEIEEMVGHAALEFFHPQAKKENPILNRPMAEWPPVSTITCQACCKDGAYIWLETTTKIIRDPGTEMIVEIIAVARNVTERKEAEDALQEAHDKLELRVQERTAELAETNAALRRFVPHEFLRILGKASIIDVSLGDQVQRDMTILFSDLRSFTSLSETMSPQDNFNFLNGYLSRVSPVIREYHGFIDKYVGDAVMALFPEQAEHALQAAIAMRREILRYNTKRVTKGRVQIDSGAGIHTGTLMLGTVGEEERLEGTVISDAVNLAYRLEGLTKMYGASIVISQHVLFNLEQPTQYRFRFLDRVRVKGKIEAVSVFEIFDGNPAETIDLKLETQTDFEKGLLHYHNQEFAEAKAHFERVKKRNPADKAAQLYLKRAAHLMEYGVPPDWEGIEALTEK